MGLLRLGEVARGNDGEFSERRMRFVEANMETTSRVYGRGKRAEAWLHNLLQHPRAAGYLGSEQLNCGGVSRYIRHLVSHFTSSKPDTRNGCP